jgi:hypothetical protein
MVKQKLAEMAALVYAMDASTYLTAALIDDEQDDIMLETAILKVFASESLWKILYDTMQIFGGRSFFRTEPFERMMRDARINMIGEGSNDVLRVFIAAVGMREVGVAYKSLLESMKHPASAAGACAEIARRLVRSVSKPKIPVRSSRLAPETERLRRSIRRFSLSVLRLLLTYREAVAENQLQLNRIAEGAMSLYTTAAVLSRVDSRLQCGATADAEVDTARFYCTLALDRLEESLDQLRSRNRDSEVEALSDRITGRRPS